MSKARDIADSTTTLDVDGGTIKLDGNYPVGTNNVALGNTALDSIASDGTRNTALGFAAGTALTTQDYNVFVGSYSGDGATGSSNTAVGDVTLRNTSGSFNTAIGGEALTSNTTASDNTAVGYQALYANTTASGSVAVGRASAASNTTGVNTSVGDYSLNSNTTGSNNTALGKQALQLNTTASYNTAVGIRRGIVTLLATTTLPLANKHWSTAPPHLPTHPLGMGLGTQKLQEITIRLWGLKLDTELQHPQQTHSLEEMTMGSAQVIM